MDRRTGTVVSETREPVSRRGGDPLFVFLAGTAGVVVLAIAAVLVDAAGPAVS